MPLRITVAGREREKRGREGERRKQKNKKNARPSLSLSLRLLTFLMYAAMSFSMLYFSRACVAQSMASCCMSSDMSAFFTTALRSLMVLVSSGVWRERGREGGGRR